MPYETPTHADCQHAFIGKVEYLSDKKLFGTGRSIFMNRVDPEKIARSLLMKRNAFKHEPRYASYTR